MPGTSFQTHEPVDCCVLSDPNFQKSRAISMRQFFVSMSFFETIRFVWQVKVENVSHRLFSFCIIHSSSSSLDNSSSVK